MKFLKSLLWVALLLACVMPAYAIGGKCGSNIKWELDNNGCLTISGQGAMQNYSYGETPWLPALVKTIEICDGVTTISRNAFAKTRITSVVIPAGVEIIDDGAFRGCKQLASVTMPYGLKGIGARAFDGCEVLPRVIMPSSVTYIGDRAFANCRTLREISVPSRVKTVGQNAFKECKNLMTIGELPDFITTDNYSVYGLAYTPVSKYYQAASQAAEMAVVAKTEEPAKKKPETKKATTTTPAYGQSDVDAPLAGKPQNNSNTFAIIIANEHYANLADVPFAHNDGNSFATYCRSVLGLPNSNINLYTDATSGTMKAAMSYLQDIDDAYNGDINVLFYYAGHGSPSDDTKESFLIPVDAAKVDRNYCYALDDLYSQLSDLKAGSIKVFLDACFSGPARDNTMIEEARKIAVVPKKATLKGNLVVLSAASDDQTAWQYDEQGHGLFTYFLLKKLRETSGDVTMDELTDYISTNVLRTSVVVNRKRQTPAVAASPELGQRWRTWTVK